jgi:hypothetical protein
VSLYAAPEPLASEFHPVNLCPVFAKELMVNAFAVPETIERLLILPEVEVLPLNAILNDLAVQIA